MCEFKDISPLVFEKKIFVATAYKNGIDYIQLPITQSKVIQERPFEQT